MERLPRRRALARVGREHPVDGPAELAGKVGAQLGERLGALLHAARGLERRDGPEGMTAGQRLHRMTPSDQTSAAPVASAPPNLSGAM